MKKLILIENEFNKIEQALGCEIYEFSCCDYYNLNEYHYGLGTYIRNNILINGSHLCGLLEECGLYDLDEMSDLVIRLFYIYIKLKK